MKVFRGWFLLLFTMRTIKFPHSWQTSRLTAVRLCLTYLGSLWFHFEDSVFSAPHSAVYYEWRVEKLSARENIYHCFFSRSSCIPMSYKRTAGHRYHDLQSCSLTPPSKPAFLPKWPCLCTFNSVYLDLTKVAEAPPWNCKLSEKASTSHMAGSQCG